MYTQKKAVLRKKTNLAFRQFFFLVRNVGGVEISFINS